MNSAAESLIHLRLSAARKGRWVRASRTAGLRLTDWIINIVESHMAKKSYIEQSADDGLIDHATARDLAVTLSGRGGPGRGQGAKAADGATNCWRVNVTIDPISDAIAHRAGPDRSSGIRIALKFWNENHRQPK